MKNTTQSKGIFGLILMAMVMVQWLWAGGPQWEVSLQDWKMVTDTLPLRDRFGSFLEEEGRNPFDLKDPAIIEKGIEYDPVTGQYIVTEKIGDEDYRPQTFYTYDEYVRYKQEKQEREYFNKLAGLEDGKDLEGVQDPITKLDIKKSLVDRLFGGNQVTVEPQGRIGLSFGAIYQRNRNPTLPTRQQNQIQPDFQMDIQMSVTGKIGEKLNLNANYNSGATFNFDRQLKLDYDTENFGEDEILKKIEAGNVSLPIKGSLITGSQSLFGLKTELQFGHLKLTAVASQQKSEQESITLENGAIEQTFEVRPDEYDENRHFFVSHFNRGSYEKALANLPEVNSLFAIKNIEVWITDDGNATRETRFRDIVALADLGEGDPDKFTTINPGLIEKPSPAKGRNGEPLPYNEANKLYALIKADPNAQFKSSAVSTLSGAPYRLRASRDFEKVRARRLETNEFSYNPQLGFISLRVRPRENQVVAVSFEYRYKGNIYKVGDLTNEVKSDSTGKVLFTKLLKSSVQNVKDKTWDLMMKNVYPIGAFNVTNEDFKMDIFYEAPSGKQERFFTELGGYPLINFFRLDNLNERRDPQPDGTFDFVPGLTIIPNSGTIVFPVLEPFGSSMLDRFNELAKTPQQAQQLYDTYGYDSLYVTTPTAARFELEKNRFYLKGTYKSSTSSEISLGAFNIPKQGLTVRAGGQVLKEGQDYEVDYGIGRVRILNDAVLQSGVPITINYEDNALFSFQTKTMLGLRADYELNKDMNIGATYLHLFEQPFTGKVNIGDDPINNRIVGLDFNMTKDAPWLTRAVDFLPFYQTKQPSKITVQAEGAAIIPGHSKAIEQKDSEGGVVYVDDFEGAASSIIVTTPIDQWVVASIPQGQDDIWREASLSNDLASGANRARFSWYQLDHLSRRGSDGEHSYTREVDVDDIFPNRQRVPGLTPLLRTFDVTFYPTERGPYNMDLLNGRNGYSLGVDADNRLKEPATRWGGMMKKLNTNDFEEANVEYIEFWVLNPYMDKQDKSLVSEGGKIQIHLGNVSEDIFKDSRQQFENSLPVGDNNLPVDNSAFGRIARNAPLVDNAFDLEDRDLQDIGYDGLDDNDEVLFFSDYIQAIQPGLNPQANNDLLADPANDNFYYFGNNTKFSNTDGALVRYKYFNNPQGNSKAPSGTRVVEAFTNYPDREDLNRDKSLNENENYFSYELDLKRTGDSSNYEIDLNDRTIRDRVTDTLHLKRPNNLPTEIWYRFRVPINDWNRRIGGIENFRSIQFMRMVMHGFTQQTTFRFAKLELVRNQWRRYEQSSCQNDVTGNLPSIDVVNIEEHCSRVPFPYVVPRGIQRERTVGTYADQLQNEQSIALDVKDLYPDCDRSMFKLVNLDMRNFERMKMFVHGESPDYDQIEEGELYVFMKLGRDFKENYYEYEIPLKLTANVAANMVSTCSSGANAGVTTALADSIWPDQNFIDFALQSLVDAKLRRNEMNVDLTAEFDMPDPENPNNTIRVKGNPTLGFVKGIQIGVRNKSDKPGAVYELETWYNELRLTGLNERGGVAALARLDLQMADLGSFTAAANYTGIGYGGLDQKLAERAQEETVQFDLSTNLELGKFLPKESGVTIPFYAQYSKTAVIPQYDPVDLDVRYADRKNSLGTQSEKDSLRDLAVETSTIRAFNFTNVKKNKSSKATSKPMPWDISNFSASYFWTETEEKNPIIESEKMNSQRGALDYTYSIPALYIEPLKFIKNKNLKFLTDLNFNLIPNSYGFSTVMDREQNTRKFRFSPDSFSTWQDNKFAWNRDYNLRWDLTKSIKFSFNATASAVVDELLYQPLRGGYVDPVTNETVSVESPGQVTRYRNDNLASFGRMQQYQHNMSLNYTVPLNKIPYLDFMTARASYNGSYAWNSGSLRTIDSLGSVINNTQSIQLNGALDFTKLYNQIDYLKEIDRGSRNTTRKRSSRGQQADQDIGQNDKEVKEKRKKKGSGPSSLERVLIRPLMAIRNLKLNYQENRGTTLPGFMQSPRYFGMNQAFSSPGWAFVGGLQPNLGSERNPGWLDKLAGEGFVSSNINQSQEVLQNRDRKADARMTVEPFPNFKIDLSAMWNKSSDFSELFSDTIPNTMDELVHQVPYSRGAYTISYLSLQTIFKDDILGLFRDFERMRPAISQRIGRKYGITEVHDLPEEAARGYVDGFGSQHVDVVIPAFLAAYSGRTADQARLNYFNTIPLPNWSLNYNGLSRMGIFKEVFENFSLRHGYSSTLTVSNFESALRYTESTYGVPDRKIDDTRSYYARYEIPTIVVSEQFSPLLGIEFKTKSRVTMGLEYKKSRTLSLQTDRYDLNEDKNTEYTLKLGYVLQNLKLFGKKKKKRGKNREDDDDKDKLIKIGRSTGGAKTGDLEFAFDFSFRDNIRINYKLDEERDPEPLNGSKTLTISPTASYQLNQNLKLRLYFDYTNTKPYVSNQFERTDIRGGVSVEFQLN